MCEKKLWIGIDVSAKTFDAAIDFSEFFPIHENPPVETLPEAKFQATSDGVKEFFKWIGKNKRHFFKSRSKVNVKKISLVIIMETTGVYSSDLKELILEVDEELDVRITQPHPIASYRKALKLKNKTDKADAQVIARYGFERNPKGERKTSKKEKYLRALVKTRIELSQHHSRLLNQIDSCRNPFCKKKLVTVTTQVRDVITEIETEIENEIASQPELKNEVEILKSMPGIGTTTAITIIAQVGSLKDYATREKLVAMCGLNPVRRQSGTSVNGTRLSKQGPGVIRQFLYMCTKTAIPKIEPLKDLYDRLVSRGKSKLQARCAVMRKMLIMLRAMVIHGKFFDEKFKISPNLT